MGRTGLKFTWIARGDPSGKMGKMNKEWHAEHAMPKNPRRDERIEWHLQHAKNCACREMPRDIALEIAKLRKLAIRHKEQGDREGHFRKPQTVDERRESQ